MDNQQFETWLDDRIASDDDDLEDVLAAIGVLAIKLEKIFSSKRRCLFELYYREMSSSLKSDLEIPAKGLFWAPE